MNLVRAHVGDTVGFGSFQIPLDHGRSPNFGGDVVLGIRPEAFEDAAFAPPSLPQIDVRVEVLEELGSDAYAFFEVDAKPVIVEEALSDEEEEAATLLAVHERALFAARVDPRTSARVGEQLRLAVDPSRFYFFAPATGDSLLRAAA
jgi:multiple sugar transport system ATP-binding protein